MAEEFEADVPVDGGALKESGPRPQVKQGGWGEESAKPKAGRRAGGKDDAAPDEDERFNQQPAPEEPESDEDAIPTLPDVQEVAPDPTSQIAEAPSAAIRVQTIAELDKDLSTSFAFALDSGIDLKLLTGMLAPPESLLEGDQTWEYNRLFTEVKSAIESEREALARKSEEQLQESAENRPLDEIALP